MRDTLSQADTTEWVRMALADELPHETPEQRMERMATPETDTARFIREALGEPAPTANPIFQKRGLLVLLKAEQERRRSLKQQADNRQ